MNADLESEKKLLYALLCKKNVPAYIALMFSDTQHEWNVIAVASNRADAEHKAFAVIEAAGCADVYASYLRVQSKTDFYRHFGKGWGFHMLLDYYRRIVQVKGLVRNQEEERCEQ